jgi:macrolide transport system ATP-binding/permease protein
MFVLQTINLTKKFVVAGQKITVLKDVSFSIQSGEMVSILGSSGSGKSTLLNILGCLDVPTAGSYWLAGQEVAQLSSEALTAIRCRHIGFVFQKFNLINSLTVQENIILPQLYNLVSRQEAAARALHLLSLVGLADRRNFLPYQLSGGQQQRVCIARALANNPAIILADEPTGSLDAENGQKVIELFLQLKRELQITIVLVTHDLAIAEQANQIFRLIQGCLMQKNAT